MGGSADEKTRFRYKGTIPQEVLSAHCSVSLFSKVFRCLFWTVIAVYFIAVAVLLGLRYWVLPNIDQWRPRIEAYASDALGAERAQAIADCVWQLEKIENITELTALLRAV